MMKSTVVTNAMIENMFGMVIKACFAAAAEYVSEQPQEVPKKIKATRAPRIVSREEGKKDSFSIPGESKVIPENVKSTRKENKVIAGRTERRKTFVKNMSSSFGGTMTDKQVAASMGTCVQTVKRYKSLIKAEMERDNK